jgi:hypothetical protein
VFEQGKIVEQIVDCPLALITAFVLGNHGTIADDHHAMHKTPSLLNCGARGASAILFTYSAAAEGQYDTPH